MGKHRQCLQPVAETGRLLQGFAPVSHVRRLLQRQPCPGYPGNNGNNRRLKGNIFHSV